MFTIGAGIHPKHKSKSAKSDDIRKISESVEVDCDFSICDVSGATSRRTVAMVTDITGGTRASNWTSDQNLLNLRSVLLVEFNKSFKTYHDFSEFISFI